MFDTVKGGDTLTGDAPKCRPRSNHAVIEMEHMGPFNRTPEGKIDQRASAAHAIW